MTVTGILTKVLSTVENGLSSPPGMTIVQPGSDVADDGNCQGQLWIRVVDATPIFKKNVPGVCPYGYQITVAVGIFRCIATINDRGRAPSPDQITMDGINAVTDMVEIARSLQCLEPADIDSNVQKANVGNWTPLGPEGNRAGGEWQYVIQTDLNAWADSSWSK